MRQLKDVILEKLKISKTKESNDFATLLSLLKEVKSISLDSLFTGNKKGLNKTHSGGSVYVIVYSEKRNNEFAIWCASKSGETSDIGTIKNNNELYEFLSTRLVDCEPEKFIDIVIDYLQNMVSALEYLDKKS